MSSVRVFISDMLPDEGTSADAVGEQIRVAWGQPGECKGGLLSFEDPRGTLL
jgi:hypothetical protein